jgi:hypothetical protein
MVSNWKYHNLQKCIDDCSGTSKCAKGKNARTLKDGGNVCDRDDRNCSGECSKKGFLFSWDDGVKKQDYCSCCRDKTCMFSEFSQENNPGNPKKYNCSNNSQCPGDSYCELDVSMGNLKIGNCTENKIK